MCPELFAWLTVLHAAATIRVSSLGQTDVPGGRASEQYFVAMPHVHDVAQILFRRPADRFSRRVLGMIFLHESWFIG